MKDEKRFGNTWQDVKRSFVAGQALGLLASAAFVLGTFLEKGTLLPEGYISNTETILFYLSPFPIMLIIPLLVAMSLMRVIIVTNQHIEVRLLGFKVTQRELISDLKSVFSKNNRHSIVLEFNNGHKISHNSMHIAYRQELNLFLQKVAPPTTQFDEHQGPTPP